MQSKVPNADREIMGDPPAVSEPQPPVDPLNRPFVGNETIDDNLRENVKVAIWNLMGDRERNLQIEVNAGVATLSGPVTDKAEASRLVATALSVSGVSNVVNRLQPAPSSSRPRRLSSSASEAPHKARSVKMVTLTRFCGLDDASTSAAIRQAVGRLEHFFTERKLPLPEKLFIVYRNLIPGAITLELGFPAPVHGTPNLEGEFRLMDMPVAAEQVATAAPGLIPLLSTLRELMRAGHTSAFQVLTADDFRPWRGHPALPLNIRRGS